MTAMTSHFDPGERSVSGAPCATRRSDRILRYRGVAYLRADLPGPLPAACDAMIYRGLRYHAPLSNPAPVPTVGRRRNRVVAH